jgi:hypothetical protein
MVAGYKYSRLFGRGESDEGTNKFYSFVTRLDMWLCIDDTKTLMPEDSALSPDTSNLIASRSDLTEELPSFKA